MATHSSILAWRIPMDRRAWRATVHRVTKSQTWLSDWAQHVETVVWFCTLLDLYCSVQLLSRVWFFATPWTCQASLSFTISQSLLKHMFIKLVMPSNHLILYQPLLLPPPIFPNIRVFSNESILHIRWQSIGVSPSASVLPMNIQDWFPLGLTGSLCSPKNSQMKTITSSNTCYCFILLEFSKD